MVYFCHSSKHLFFFTWTLLIWINYNYCNIYSQQYKLLVFVFLNNRLCCSSYHYYCYYYYDYYCVVVAVVILVNLFATMKDLLIKFWSLFSLLSLLFLLHAPWLTKSSKRLRTLSCTQIFLTIANLKNSALCSSSHSSFVLDHLAFFTLFLTLILSSISEFPSSVNYSKAN